LRIDIRDSLDPRRAFSLDNEGDVKSRSTTSDCIDEYVPSSVRDGAKVTLAFLCFDDEGGFPPSLVRSTITLSTCCCSAKEGSPKRIDKARRVRLFRGIPFLLALEVVILDVLSSSSSSSTAYTRLDDGDSRVK